jgi:hypothetical protein
MLATNLEHAITFAALKCLGTKELSKHRDLLVAGAEHPIVLAVCGTAGANEQKAVLVAKGELVCERDATRQTTPGAKEIVAAILSLSGAGQRSKLVKMLPEILLHPAPLEEVPQEFFVVAEQLLRQLRQPKPTRGALKFVYDLE